MVDLRGHKYLMWKGDNEDMAEHGTFTYGKDTPGTGIPGEKERQEMTTRDAAYTFLEACGLTSTNDAVGQLVEAFLPALRIMCERGYDPEGETWREAGWRGLLHEIRKKNTRLHHRSWLRGLFDWDSAVDAINYLGFYIRLKNQGKPWGALGEPGSLSDEGSPVMMGDYSDVSPQ